MKRILKSDIFIRAFKTFIQGFLGTISAFLITNTSFDKKEFIALLIGALASGISAVMNYIIQLLKKGDE